MNIKKPGVFISYSHSDEGHFNELKEIINDTYCPNVHIWDDSHIKYGENWDEEIKKNLKESRFILLLISPSFLQSKYIKDKEIPLIFERHEKKDCQVIPIFIRRIPTDINIPSLEKILSIQGVATPIKPISKIEAGYRDELYLNLAKDLDNKAEEFIKAEENKIIEIKIDDSISRQDGNSGNAEKLKNLKNNCNIYLSICSSDEGMDMRKGFINQIDKKIKHDKWAYKVIPSPDEADDILKLPSEEREERIRSLIKTSVYSIHLVCYGETLETKISKLQYDLAKQEKESKYTPYKNIIWFLDSELKPKEKDDNRNIILSNPTVSGWNYKGVFDLISNLDIEKEKEINKLSPPFSPPEKSVYLCYDFHKDHYNESRIKLKEIIEGNGIRFKGSVADRLKEEEKKEIEKCQMAFIFYGKSDSSWFSLRQQIITETAIKTRVLFLDEPEIEEKLKRDIWKQEFSKIIILKGGEYFNNGGTDFFTGL